MTDNNIDQSLRDQDIDPDEISEDDRTTLRRDMDEENDLL
jgi:hypothetical protein